MESSEIQDGLRAGIGPAHAGLLEALLDNVTGSGFDRAGANRKFVIQSPAVTEPLAIVLKVLQQAAWTEFRISRFALPVEPLKSREEVLQTSFFELIQTAMPPVGGNRVFPDRLCGGMKVLSSMVEIQQLGHAVKMLVDEIPNPGCAVSKDHVELGGLKLPGL